MTLRPRLYDAILAEHLASQRQMAFVSGARQVGKTTACREQASHYLNWDNTDDRRILLGGPAATAEHLQLSRLRDKPVVAVFDELHKFGRWKAFLKGFFDTYEEQVRILVTGSSRLDVFRRGGDSLMGRYFLYRLHPFTVAEIASPNLPDEKKIIRPPRKISKTDAQALWEHGGFPEPFIKRNSRLTRRWSALRRQQLVREDIRDLTGMRELGQVEFLVDLLSQRSGEQLVYSNLAREIQVSVDTIRRWIDILCGLHLGFVVRPYFKNVTNSLRKEPKWFLRDWSSIIDLGKRTETYVACHLLKAIEGWTDLGLGKFALGYLRDKAKKEVDFIVVKDGHPWFLVEAKTGDEQLSPALTYFQKQTRAPYAFQVVQNLDYIEADCFAREQGPLVVPAATFLSQLL